MFPYFVCSQPAVPPSTQHQPMLQFQSAIPTQFVPMMEQFAPMQQFPPFQQFPWMHQIASVQQIPSVQQYPTGQQFPITVHSTQFVPVIPGSAQLCNDKKDSSEKSTEMGTVNRSDRYPKKFTQNRGGERAQTGQRRQRKRTKRSEKRVRAEWDHLSNRMQRLEGELERYSKEKPRSSSSDRSNSNGLNQPQKVQSDGQ